MTQRVSSHLENHTSKRIITMAIIRFFKRWYRFQFKFIRKRWITYDYGIFTRTCYWVTAWPRWLVLRICDFENIGCGVLSLVWSKSVLQKMVSHMKEFQKNLLSSNYPIMTSLLTHNFAHCTMHSFRPKTNNQPIKKFLSLAFTWVKVVKNWTSL